jgi:hypothetical protein
MAMTALWQHSPTVTFSQFRQYEQRKLRRLKRQETLIEAALQLRKPSDRNSAIADHRTPLVVWQGSSIHRTFGLRPR